MSYKTLILGALLAATAGWTGGGAFRPELVTSRPPMVPVADGAGSQAPLDPAGVWTCPGPTPDYVIGVGWPTPPTRAFQATTSLEPTDERFDAEAPAPLQWPAVELTEWTASSYPSQSGDILAGMSPRHAHDAEAAPEAD